MYAGQRQGPVERGVVEQLIGAGQIGAETLVWTQGMNEWAAAGTVAGFGELIRMTQASAPPAPPVVPGPVVVYREQTGVVYAGFWLRFVAMLIDEVLLQIVYQGIGFVLAMPTAIGFMMGRSAMAVGAASILVSWPLMMCVAWVYAAVMESSSSQGTLGKMALGLKVTDMQGRRVTFARATGRHFGKIVSGITLLVGYIMAGFTERKQAMHDMMAGTLVVKSR